MSDALLTRIAVALEALVAIKGGKPPATGTATGKPATAGATQTQKPPAQSAAAATGKPATAPAAGAKATPAPGTKPAASTKPNAAAPKPAAARAAAPAANGMPPDDTKDPNGKNTFGNVVAALRKLNKAQGKDVALAVLAKAGGGVGTVRDLKPPMFDAVVGAVEQALNPVKATAAGAGVVTDGLGDPIDTSGASAATAGEDDPPEGNSGEDL